MTASETPPMTDLDKLEALDADALGAVTWHSSGEDEGPNVGLQLGLGEGASLWLGEGEGAGWQFALVLNDAFTPVAKVFDDEQARELFDRISKAIQAARAAHTGEG